MNISQQTLLHATIHQEAAMLVIIDSIVNSERAEQLEAAKIMLKACLKNSAEQLEKAAA